MAMVRTGRYQAPPQPQMRPPAPIATCPCSPSRLPDALCQTRTQRPSQTNCGHSTGCVARSGKATGNRSATKPLCPFRSTVVVSQHAVANTRPIDARQVGISNELAFLMGQCQKPGAIGSIESESVAPASELALVTSWMIMRRNVRSEGEYKASKCLDVPSTAAKGAIIKSNE